MKHQEIVPQSTSRNYISCNSTKKIDFKILLLVFKSLNKHTLKYLQELIVKKEQRREGLRSSTKHNLLEIPVT